MASKTAWSDGDPTSRMHDEVHSETMATTQVCNLERASLGPFGRTAAAWTRCHGRSISTTSIRTPCTWTPVRLGRSPVEKFIWYPCEGAARFARPQVWRTERDERRRLNVERVERVLHEREAVSRDEAAKRVADDRQAHFLLHVEREEPLEELDREQGAADVDAGARPLAHVDAAPKDCHGLLGEPVLDHGRDGVKVRRVPVVAVHEHEDVGRQRPRGGGRGGADVARMRLPASYIGSGIWPVRRSRGH